MSVIITINISANIVIVVDISGSISAYTIVGYDIGVISENTSIGTNTIVGLSANTIAVTDAGSLLGLLVSVLIVVFVLISLSLLAAILLSVSVSAVILLSALIPVLV